MKTEKALSFASRREYIISGNTAALEVLEQSSENEASKAEGSMLEQNEDFKDENVDEDIDEGVSQVKAIPVSESYQEHGDKTDDQKKEDSKKSPRMKKEASSTFSIPGLKLPLTELNRTKNMTCKIISSEIISEGFFSASYLSFKLTIFPWETEIERRDKDFNTLREYFEKMFPHVLLPPISDRKNTKKHDDWYIHKRTNILQRFLNKCLDIEELKGSEVFLEFLTNKNSKTATKSLKTGYDNAKVPEDASQYPTMSGEHEVLESPALQKFSEKFNIYMNSYEVLSNQFYNLSKQLNNQYEELASTQKKMAE